MPDVFLSYNREDQAVARRFAEALEGAGFSVWWDTTLRAGEAYDEVTEAALNEAKAVVVLWSPRSVSSRWVRAEATQADRNKTLVPATIEPCRRPIMFELTQTAELSHWDGSPSDEAWLAFLADVTRFVRGAAAVAPRPAPAPPAPRPMTPDRLSICVLPFANMSDDPQQEYFSDGISEDIITDLSKVSALSVVARNTAFTFKGKSLDIKQVARELGVSHVLEGSVRKAGQRLRITAQLIDGKAGDHIWADRFDRDLDDIFALQDEISEAIVTALKLKLLPEEKKAIERRGTANPEAYDLYLMARQQRISGNYGDNRREDAIIRLCRRAIEIDPDYAQAWALLGYSQSLLQFRYGKSEVSSIEAVDRALALDPNLAEAHAVKAEHLRLAGNEPEALAEIALAVRLDPDSLEVNSCGGMVNYAFRRFEDAVRFWEKALALDDADYHSPSMLISSYTKLGDRDGALRSARTTIERVKALLAKDPTNGAALGHGVSALAVLGEAQTARDWIRKALLIDPDNVNMHYNLACALCVDLQDSEASLDLLASVLEKSAYFTNYARSDPDLDPLRGDPRFEAILTEAEARFAPKTQDAGAAGG